MLRPLISIYYHIGETCKEMGVNNFG